MISSLLFLATSALSGGCVPYWQGKDTDAEILALKGQVDSLVESQRRQRLAVETSISDFNKKLDLITKKLDASVVSLRTNSANSGSHIDELRAVISRLQGEIAELKHNISSDVSVLPELDMKRASLPKSRRDLFNFGAKAFESGNCVDAVRAFDQFAKLYPKDANTDNALTLLGECLNQQGQYRDAIRTLTKIFTEFPSGNKVDDALYVMHESLIATGRCKKARECLKQLLDNHPRSNRRADALAALKRLKKECNSR